MKKIFSFFILLVMVSCAETTENKTGSAEALKSLQLRIDSIYGPDVNPELRKDRIEEAFDFIDDIPSDSLRSQAFFKLAYSFYKNEDSLNFLKTNQKSLLLSQKLKDTSSIAESYWDKANFFLGHGQMDSAYFYFDRAEKLYESTQEDLKAGRMLLSMAIIQKDIKDYTGSEVSTIRAINIFKPYKKTKLLYSAYNNLGIIYNELEEYETALDYHQTARDYLENFGKGNIYNELTLNNIGVVYHNMGKYREAEAYFMEALENDELRQQDKILYAMLLDNLAYAQMYSGEEEGVLDLFLEALDIRENIDHTSGQVINKIHLSEYYLQKEDSLTAYNYAASARDLAESSNNHRDYLKSLLLVSRLSTINSNKALREYISVNDSLQKQEREVRNKFARIRLETNELIERTEQLSLEKNWILLFSGFFLIILHLLFYIRIQRAKTRELLYEQDQRLADEEIYELISQKKSELEDVRQAERERISRDLHDGIVGKIFGTRLNFEFIDLKGSPEELEKFSSLTRQLQNIENEIRNISHDLMNEKGISGYNFPGLVKSLINERQYDHLKIDLFIDNRINWENFAGNLKINLYRIVQEALQNIRKHSGATEVKISIKRSESGRLKLMIKDNGSGFRSKEVKNGLGIRNMRNRIEKFNGELKIQTSPNQGTTLVFSIPNQKN